MLADLACNNGPRAEAPALAAWDGEIEKSLEALSKLGADAPDGERRAWVVHDLLRNSASIAERPTRNVSGPDRVKALRGAIAHRRRALAAARGSQAIELEGMALGEASLLAREGPAQDDPGVTEELDAILELNLSWERSQLLKAAVLRFKGDAALALELAETSAKAADDTTRDNGVALLALLAIDRKDKALARQRLKQFARDARDRSFTFGYTIGELRELCREPP